MISKEIYDGETIEKISFILNKQVPRVKYYAHKNYNSDFNLNDWKFQTSKECLNFLWNRNVCISETKNLFNFSSLSITEKFIYLIEKKYPNKKILQSGAFYYPNGGYMGWHNNSDFPCERLYITYSSEEKKSFFRYYDHDNDKIITDYDNKGLTIRKFLITGNNPYFWHCVGSECDRFSFGFRLIDL